jgi:hypothetical protein
MRLCIDIILTACCVVLTLVFLELGLRAGGAKFEGSFYQQDPVTNIAFRPNAQGWELEGESFSKINSLGMHDRERSVAVPPRTLRIAVIGDSLLAAQQVPLEKTMAQRLEASLSTQALRTNHKIEVLNFGVGGFTLAQVYLNLEKRVWRFNPDIIIMFLSPLSVPSATRQLNPLGSDSPFFTYKDGRLVLDSGQHPVKTFDQSAIYWRGKLKDVYNKVYLAQLVFQACQTLQERAQQALAQTRPKDSIHEFSFNRRAFSFLPDAAPEQKQAWSVAEGLLDLMNSAARAHGAEFWLVNFGDSIQADPDPQQRQRFMHEIGVSDLDYSDRRLAKFAEERQLPYIDLAPRLLQYAAKNNVLLYGFFNTARNYGHLNETGNQVVADVLAKALIASSSKLVDIVPGALIGAEAN